MGVLVATTFLSQRAVAQGDSGPCMAPTPRVGERTGWYDADGLYVLDSTPKSSETIVQKFAGTYTLLVVTTEGTLEKVLAEYRLTLAPPSPTQLAEIHQLPAAAEGRLLVPLVGVLHYARGATGSRKTDGAPWPDLTGDANFEYWPNRGKLAFSVGLGIDSGTLFQVTHVEADGGFSGRWTNGGYVAIQVDTPVGAVLEMERGYFCAMPAGR